MHSSPNLFVVECNGSYSSIPRLGALLWRTQSLVPYLEVAPLCHLKLPFPGRILRSVSWICKMTGLSTRATKSFYATRKENSWGGASSFRLGSASHHYNSFPYISLDACKVFWSFLSSMPAFWCTVERSHSPLGYESLSFS